MWKEILLLIGGLCVLVLAIRDEKIRTHTLTRRLVWLIITYGVLQLAVGLLAYRLHHVTLQALGYGLIVNTRFLIFFLVAWAVAVRLQRLRVQWQRLVLWPAVVVVSFGLLQAFVLPNDFLTHFGYGAHTIQPYATINSNQAYVRIESTLRGANPLGAYLLIPISLLGVLLVREKRNWQRVVLLLASITTLFFTFSRSAWLGATFSLAIIAASRANVRYLSKRRLALGAVILICAVGAVIILQHSARFENLVFHTESHSRIKSTSDQGHTVAFKQGVQDIVHQPLGRGVGTAGPASVYNHGQTRIAENYFVQIGQETGVIGLLLFVLINAGIGYLLWSRRSDPLAFSLFASLIGLTFINFLSHAWADDTLAYVWWGLAGIAMAPMPEKEPKAEQVKDAKS